MLTTLERTRSPGCAVRRNAVSVGGRPGARPVVFAHGFGCDQSMWRAVCDHFAESSTVVLFDHVGAGASDRSAYDARRHASLRGYAADLVEVLDELAPELFSALVLVGASPRYLDDHAYVGGFSRADVDAVLEAVEGNWLGWSQALAPVAMGNPDRPELAEQLADSFARTESRIAAEFARAIFLSDHRRDLAAVTAPTLVVQTAADPMVPESVGLQMHRGIPGSAHVALGTTGHFPHLAGPGETAGVVRRFLDGLADDRSH